MNKHEALVEWQGGAEVAEEEHLQESLVYRKSHPSLRGGRTGTNRPSNCTALNGRHASTVSI